MLKFHCGDGKITIQRLGRGNSPVCDLLCATELHIWVCVKWVLGMLSDAVEASNLHIITSIRFSYSFGQKRTQLYKSSVPHWIMIHS